MSDKEKKEDNLPQEELDDDKLRETLQGLEEEKTEWIEDSGENEEPEQEEDNFEDEFLEDRIDEERFFEDSQVEPGPIYEISESEDLGNFYQSESGGFENNNLLEEAFGNPMEKLHYLTAGEEGDREAETPGQAEGPDETYEEGNMREEIKQMENQTDMSYQQ